MGRRFLLILAILLLVPPALPLARAQERGGPPAPPEGAPGAPSELPVPKPLDLPATEGSLPPVERPQPSDSEPATAGQKGGPAPVPPLEPAGPEGKPRHAEVRPGPPEDAGLTRTEGVADAKAAGQPPTAAAKPATADNLDGIPAERVPMGKQSVAVTVDVQSPLNMNLHQPAIVRLLIRNTGTADALQVRIRDELPEGLKFVSSAPEPDHVDRDSILSWTLQMLPAGSEKVIAVKVEPVKTGPVEHGATVWFQTGSGAQTKVLQPKLKVEQLISATSVLKGHAVEFKIKVTNDGDGPATNVRVVAKLSPGLRYGSGSRGNSEVVTDPIAVLGPGQSEELDPLVADAMVEGPASCTVTARSPDVIPQNKDEEARNEAKVTVVEPKLAVVVAGPQKRCTDTDATYEIAVSNPGTAPAKKVRITALIPTGARLKAVPERARYDQATRRVQWSIDVLEPGSTPQKLSFDVKVGDVGKYEFAAEALGTAGLKAKNSLITDVFGMPDIDLVVSERQRVVDVGGTTFFLIRVRNYGTKDATNIQLSAKVSENLEVTGSFDMPSGLEFMKDTKGGPDGALWLRDAQGNGIKRLGPGKELVMGLEVKAKAAEPKFATCRVTATHDDLSGNYEDMAGVKVLPSSSRPAAAGR
jgi:uncharacterized repeat protein (TIGR01451 family)